MDTQNNYLAHRAINVLDVIDHTTKPMTTEGYLAALGDDSMMLEAVTLEELEATHMYGLASAGGMMLEAITTTKGRVDKTMAAFVRALNQQLNASGLEAYTAEVGKTGKAGQLAVLTSRIPLSDGQSVAIVFHSPSGDPGKIVANDDLVAFRFLLNKRDVTHVVAPSGGQDISLKQTCLSLANLAERNSEKFQSKQASNQAKEAELATLQASTEQLQAETAGVIEKVDLLAEQAAEDGKALAKTQALLDKQIAKNDELRRKLAKLGGTTEPGTAEPGTTEPGTGAPSAATLPAPTDTIRNVNQGLNMDGEHTLTNGAKIAKVLRDEGGSLEGYITLTEPGGKAYVLKSKSSQGGAMQDTAKVLYKAYREGKAEKYLGGIPGEGMTEAEAERLLSEMNFGTKTQADYADMSAPAEVISAQLLALTRLYGEMDEAITNHVPDWTFGKTTREHLLGHYLQISNDHAHEIANNLTRGKMPNGDAINVPSPTFGAENLVRGVYSTGDVLSRLLELGGTYKGAPKGELIKYARRQRAWAENAQFNAQASYDKAKEQGVEAEFEKALTRANARLAAFDSYLETLTAPKPEIPVTEPTEPPAQGGKLYWYGLRARPLSIGAQPKGSAAYIDPENAQTDPRIAELVKAQGPESVRHGAVAYDRELTPQEVASYELVDFGRLAAAWNESRRAAALVDFKATVKNLLDSDEDPRDIWKDLVNPNGKLVTNNPFYDWDTERYRGDELTKALQEGGYSGTVKGMFDQLAEELWAQIEDERQTPEEREEERKKKIRAEGVAELEAFLKGGRFPKGWSGRIDPDFGLRGAIEITTPSPLPNGDEHGGYYIIPATTGYNALSGGWKDAQANSDSILKGEFGLLREDGGGMEVVVKTWGEAMRFLQEDYQSDVAAATPKPGAGSEPADSDEPQGNQWNETDQEVLALLEQAEQLRTTETDTGKYLAELQRIAAGLEAAGAIERHEPYLHTVSDRLTELMEAEGV